MGKINAKKVLDLTKSNLEPLLKEETIKHIASCIALELSSSGSGLENNVNKRAVDKILANIKTNAELLSRTDDPIFNNPQAMDWLARSQLESFSLPHAKLSKLERGPQSMVVSKLEMKALNCLQDESVKPLNNQEMRQLSNPLFKFGLEVLNKQSPDLINPKVVRALLNNLADTKTCLSFLSKMVGPVYEATKNKPVGFTKGAVTPEAKHTGMGSAMGVKRFFDKSKPSEKPETPTDAQTPKSTRR